MQWLSIKPPFMQFRAELGELGVCQVLSLQVTLSDSSHSRVTGMKQLLWHNQLTCCRRLSADKIGMISCYQALLRSCDLMHIWGRYTNIFIIAHFNRVLTVKQLSRAQFWADLGAILLQGACSLWLGVLHGASSYCGKWRAETRRGALPAKVSKRFSAKKRPFGAEYMRESRAPLYSSIVLLLTHLTQLEWCHLDQNW